MKVKSSILNKDKLSKLFNDLNCYLIKIFIKNNIIYLNSQ